MKTGILTFHWATNYGAVLQCYALQTYLESLGHDVKVINYKPRNYDLCIRDVLRPSNLKRTPTFLKNLRKEKNLEIFRRRYLHLTKRVFSETEFADLDAFDLVISGSDQVLNPFFTMNGEGHPTSAYYLTGFADCRKVGYAVSFGCTTYPPQAAEKASGWINEFDSLSVRESTGQRILSELGYKGYGEVVPDPTLLLCNDLFGQIDINRTKDDYTYVYMLHRKEIGKDLCRSLSTPVLDAGRESRPSLELWLSRIASAGQMITNSYHGMIMSVLMHVPFVVLADQDSLAGMNDRFYTLLSSVGLENRIVPESDHDRILSTLPKPIDWDSVDGRLKKYALVGQNFLKKCLNEGALAE